MERYLTFGEPRWKHFGYAISLGIGIIIGAIMHRLYGKNEKRSDLTAAIKSLSEQVAALSNEIAMVKEKPIKTGERSRCTGNYEHFGEYSEDEEEDGDLFYETESTKNLSDALISDSTISIEKRLKQSELLREGTDRERRNSYELLLELSKEIEPNADLFWRLGRAQYDMAMLAGKEGNIDEKHRFMREAMGTCKKAVELNDDNAFAHKWYGIAVGNYVEFVGSKEKIELGYEYKKHIERAIELNPEDPSAYSLLGRWCFEVAMLPWYLRKVAAAVYGEPPTSSIDEALSFAMKAEERKPNFWKENSLLIAKCYYQKSDYKTAKEWLYKARALPVNSEDDAIAQRETDELLQKVKNY